MRKDPGREIKAGASRFGSAGITSPTGSAGNEPHLLSCTQARRVGLDDPDRSFHLGLFCEIRDPISEQSIPHGLFPTWRRGPGRWERGAAQRHPTRATKPTSAGLQARARSTCPRCFHPRYFISKRCFSPFRDGGILSPQRPPCGAQLPSSTTKREGGRLSGNNTRRQRLRAEPAVAYICRIRKQPRVWP